MSGKIKQLYSEAHLEQLSRETGFTRRRSRLTGRLFLEMLLSSVFDHGEVSLNDHSVTLGITHNIQVRKQSLDERFNAQSVDFVRTLLEQQLNNQINEAIDVKILSCFNAVKIKDSTCYQLPACLKDVYPGNGGAASEAGVRIQFEFDLLSGKVTDYQVTADICKDQKDAAATLDQVKPGDLILRDMGYFSMDVLEKIDEQKAWYISRIKPKVQIYECKNGNFEVLDLTQVYQRVSRSRLPYLEMEVFIGEKKKMPVRILIECMPPYQVEKRLRKARKEARKKGRMLSSGYQAYAALNLFITNVRQQDLPAQHIRTLYRLRWQIELRFKVWKGFCRLHAVKKMKQHRFETYLYSCLLFIFISWEIAVNLLSLIWQSCRQLLSISKCYKAILQTANTFRDILFNATEKLGPYLEKLYAIGREQLLTEPRKGHLSQQEILLIDIEKLK